MTILSAGTPAPGFALHTTHDQTISLPESRDRNVTLALFHTGWNSVCGNELTWVNERRFWLPFEASRQVDSNDH